MYDWLMRRALLIFLCVGFVATPQLFFAQYCDKLTSKSGKEAFVSYLEKYPKENWGQECVASAIKKLASDRNDEPAARVLVWYLDYYWKDPGCEGVGGGVCMGPYYPAMNSLMEIGDASRPYVLQALKSDSISQRTRENAVDVYYYFIRDDTAQGVSALRWEADRTGDPKAKEHLLWAASALAQKWCYPFEKKPHRCEAALAGTLPFNVEEDTYSVYEAIIPKEPNPWPFEEYAIAKRTLSRHWSQMAIRACIKHPSDEKSEYDSAIADFVGRNGTPELLDPKMRPLGKPYVLLDEKDVSAYRRMLRSSARIAPEDQAPDYQFGISGPLISVSRVGFSKDGTIAIVYVQHECPSACSGGALHVLRRHANFWTEESIADCE